ncbi:hypothetical protein ACFPVT_06625 [Corynebacterium choanae]|uniref:Uncharacterized protein n=1 Tax=Corynebacterium choanae TaxID=1862358 RepID=A0A3G6J7K5_9CORY|nr:hypothetical protein [Corynebacterium choanae]AZA13753.1 hypothetical protein CCHOA_06805 [Corynebacterium choanae]
MRVQVWALLALVAAVTLLFRVTRRRHRKISRIVMGVAAGALVAVAVVFVVGVPRWSVLRELLHPKHTPVEQQWSASLPQAAE